MKGILTCIFPSKIETCKENITYIRGISVNLDNHMPDTQIGLVYLHVHSKRPRLKGK